MSDSPADAREQFLDALRFGDAAKMRDVLAEDFTFVDRDKPVLGRDELIAMLASGNLRFDTISVLDDTTKESGEDEVRFRTRVRLDGRLGAMRYDGEYRLLEVYRRRGDTWQAVLSSAWAIA